MVTDPDAVKGAGVSGGGAKATTDKHGRATLMLKAAKSVTVTVAKPGYTPAKLVLKGT